MVPAVAKCQRADVHPFDLLAQYREPHGGGVARALDAVPRPWWELVGACDPGVDQLALGGDLTRGRVDEERGHRPRC